jgi:hypothetical protein
MISTLGYWVVAVRVGLAGSWVPSNWVGHILFDGFHQHGSTASVSLPNATKYHHVWHVVLTGRRLYILLATCVCICRLHGHHGVLVFLDPAKHLASSYCTTLQLWHMTCKESHKPGWRSDGTWPLVCLRMPAFTSGPSLFNSDTYSL